MLEKTFENPLDSKETKPVNPKGNQSWIFIGRTDPKAEAPILWPHNAKSQFIGKDPHAGKDWGWEEKRQQRIEVAGRHHWLNGHEFEQTPGEWRARKHGVLKSMGFQRVGCNLATEHQQPFRILDRHMYCSVANSSSLFYESPVPIGSEMVWDTGGFLSVYLIYMIGAFQVVLVVKNLSVNAGDIKDVVSIPE